MTVLIDAGIVAVAAALFASAYGVALLLTRPDRPRAAPATPDLGDEPPALVNLLGSRWRLTEDAAEATLLDLAARRIIELRQPANDPYHTTIHLRDDVDGEVLSALTPYERRVLDRIRGLALDGVVPVTALTFRNQRQARAWSRRLRHEVVREARARGLSRRRFGPVVVGALSVVALQSSFLMAVTVARVSAREGEANLVAAGWVAVAAFFALSGVAGRALGERDTPAGREAAARWFGVRDWLRGHAEFADLPPAAVAVWDRYLPYGAALGVTRTASAVLDLGMGDRRRVWSSYGGGWRRVRVRYPVLWRRYGASVPVLLVRGGLALVAGFALVRWRDLPADLVAADPAGTAGRTLDLAARAGLVLGVALLALGGYLVVRTVLDLATVRTITGEVLWLEKWRTRSGGKGRPAVTWLDYLAVDDGSRDRTTAWALPRGTGDGCRARDTVTIQVRPWSRRVVGLSVITRGPVVVDAPAEAPDDGATTALGAVFGAHARRAGARVEIEQLLTVEEVGQALGTPVGPPVRAPLPGSLATAIYSTTDRSRHVLMVQVVSGLPGRLSRRVGVRGTELAGIGDGAAVHGDRAVVRVGEATATLTLLGPARDRRDHLPWLLARMAGRLPGGTPTRQDHVPG
jgi:hypothetical protein